MKSLFNKLRNITTGAAMLVAPFVAFSTAAADNHIEPPPAANNVSSSYFVNKDGLLWFQEGNDGEYSGSATELHTAANDSVAILVYATEKNLDSHINFAKKVQAGLKGWLNKNGHAGVSVDIVVNPNSKGNAFMLISNGFILKNDATPNGIMNSKELGSSLGEFSIFYESSQAVDGDIARDVPPVVVAAL